MPDFSKIIDYIESSKNIPFEWGVHDCCTFTAGAVKLMTGVDHMAEFRGYKSEKEAKKVLSPLGLYGTMKRKFKLSRPKRGTIAFHVFQTGPAIGICIGAESIFVGDREIFRVDNSECRFFNYV